MHMQSTFDISFLTHTKPVPFICHKCTVIISNVKFVGFTGGFILWWVLILCSSFFLASEYIYNIPCKPVCQSSFFPSMPFFLPSHCDQGMSYKANNCVQSKHASQLEIDGLKGGDNAPGPLDFAFVLHKYSCLYDSFYCCVLLIPKDSSVNVLGNNF